MFRPRQASDPRDRVYAYLSLMGGSISADYSLSHEEVFILWSRSLVEEYGDLLPLLRPVEVRQSPNLPTWVPDWCAKLDEADKTYGLTWLQFYPSFLAAGSARATTRPSPTGLTLDLQGLVLDQVMEVSDVSSTEQSVLETVSWWQGIGKRTGTPNNREYPRGGSYSRAAWCTVQGGFFFPKQGYAGRIGSTDDAEAQFMETLNHCSLKDVVGYRQSAFTTREGMIGLANRGIQIGDDVCILSGGKMPFIVRKADGRGSDAACYSYIGQAYVHGIMDGEAMEEGRELEWISLV
ncbi:hypothetical protein ACJ41O_015144 [Fusarium nematophilum]